MLRWLGSCQTTWVRCAASCRPSSLLDRHRKCSTSTTTFSATRMKCSTTLWMDRVQMWWKAMLRLVSTSYLFGISLSQSCFGTRNLGWVAGWQRSVVVSTLALINVVNQRWARLLLEWVVSWYVPTTSHLGQLSLHPSRVGKTSTGLCGWG